MAEYLADFKNVEPRTRFQTRTRLPLEWCLFAHKHKQWKVKKSILFLCCFISIMLSDTYNSNLSLSVAKQVLLDVNWRRSYSSCGYILASFQLRSPSKLDQFENVLSPFVTFTPKKVKKTPKLSFKKVILYCRSAHTYDANIMIHRVASWLTSGCHGSSWFSRGDCEGHMRSWMKKKREEKGGKIEIRSEKDKHKDDSLR